MTEDEARAWCTQRFPAASVVKLERYVDLLTEGGERQNLISAATVPIIWARHVVDSLQLLDLLQAGPTVDIGSGAGLPGIPLSCVGAKVSLVEPRRRRAEFLQRCVNELGLDASVQHATAKQASGRFLNVTARAVAAPGKLIDGTRHLMDDRGRWVLPAGRAAFNAELPPSIMFHVERSVTDASAGIIVASERRAG